MIDATDSDRLLGSCFLKFFFIGIFFVRIVDSARILSLMNLSAMILLVTIVVGIARIVEIVGISSCHLLGAANSEYQGRSSIIEKEWALPREKEP